MLVSNTSCSGEAGAVNVGWNLCNTDLLAVISDDDPQGPNWLPEIIKCANRYPTVGVFYPTTIIRQNSKEDRELSAWKYDRRVFHSLLRSPCLAGAVINHRLLKNEIGSLRVPGQEYPNDLTQWLNLSLICDFKEVPNAKAFWWIHPEQFSQTKSLSYLCESYIENVGVWYIKARERDLSQIGPSIILLRAIQIAFSRGISLSALRASIFSYIKLLKLCNFPIKYLLRDLIFTIFRLFRWKVQNERS